MKAVRVIDGQPTFLEIEPPSGEGVLVDVASASICGSDLHLLEMGIVEGLILGHEFAGTTPDGTAVAIEPMIGCGVCGFCEEGNRLDCTDLAGFMGVRTDGGMAEQVLVQPSMLVELPAGVPVGDASLVEPLAVAAHVVRRVAPRDDERVAIVGAGPIGLSVAAVLRTIGHTPVLFARHDHQREAGEALGARIAGEGEFEENAFDVVFDAAATTRSIAECVRRMVPRGRIGMVGTFWDPVSIDMGFSSKEATMISAQGYSGRAPDRDFDVAARALASNPAIADALITHRFPLDAAADGFAAAADRAGGAIKVLFEV